MRNKTIWPLLFILILWAGSAWGANCGGETECACGDTVTSDYTLTADLECTNAGAALTIGANNITLDLGEYTISGDSSHVTYGVYSSSSYTGATIKNGKITGITAGSYPAGAQIENQATVQNIEVYDSTDGIRINSPNSGTTGFTGTVKNNRLHDLTGYGINIAGASLVTDFTDGNMETDPTSNWSAYNATLAEEVGSPQAGSKSLKVTLTADDGYAYQDISVTAGYRYILDGYIKNAVGDTSRFKVEGLGSDLFSGWDFTHATYQWGTAGTTTIDDANSFTSAGGAGGVYRSYQLLEVNTEYIITVAGSTTASGCDPYSANLANVADRTIIGTGFGTYYFTTSATENTIYLRNSDAGTTDVTTLTIRKVTDWSPALMYEGTTGYEDNSAAYDYKEFFWTVPSGCSLARVMIQGEDNTDIVYADSMVFSGQNPKDYDGLEILNNEVYAAQKTGINNTWGDNVLFFGNYVHDPDAGSVGNGIKLGHYGRTNGGSVAIGNKIHNLENGTDNYGILLTSNCLAYNNEIKGTNRGLDFENSISGYAGAYNNTVINCTDAAKVISGSTATITIQNNILDGTNTDFTIASDVVGGYNCLKNDASVTVNSGSYTNTGTSDLYATNPLFKSATDFHLQPGSSLWGMGIPIAGLYVDKDGYMRRWEAPNGDTPGCYANHSRYKGYNNINFRISGNPARGANVDNSLIEIDE